MLIALWADETPFNYRMLDGQHPDNMDELKRHSPFAQFPLLLDDGEPVFEIDHDHRASRTRTIPAPTAGFPTATPGRRARFLDRFFDLYVMGNMQVTVFDALRPEGQHDPFGVDKARDQSPHRLRLARGQHLGDGPWAVGDAFTLADCAAAPALFYADWVEEIGAGAPAPRRLSRAAARPSDRRARGRRGPPLPRLLPARRPRPRLIDA